MSNMQTRNVISLLERCKTALMNKNDDSAISQLVTESLITEIDEALKDPEMRIPTPNGDFVVSLAHNEAIQASICLDTKAGLIDLALAEIPEGDLLTCYDKESLQEGDIRLLLWGDPFTEDYTYKTIVKSEEVQEMIQNTLEEEKDSRD